MAMDKPKNKDLEKRKKKAMKDAKKYMARGGGRSVEEARARISDKYEGLGALKKGFKKLQKRIDQPATYEGMGKRKSRKEDRGIAEGRLTDGTAGFSAARMSRERKAQSSKYKALDEGGTVRSAEGMRKSIGEMEALKKLAAKKKKKKGK